MLGNDLTVGSNAVNSEQNGSEQWVGEQSAALVVEPHDDKMDAPSAETAATARSLLTVAHLLFGAILLMAGVLLFAEMDGLPLSSAESRQALPVYQFASGEPFTVGSPAYFTLTALLSPFVGLGDVGVRVIPALFGLLTVALPWLLRRQIGTTGALVAALLLAISPTTNALTHTAGGQSIALFAALLMFMAWVNWRDSADVRWFYALTGGFALGIASAPLFYSLLLTGLIALLVGRITSTNQTDNDQPFDYANLRMPAIVGVVLFVAVSTLGFAVPSGLGAVANQFGEWFTQFRLGSGWAQTLLALVRYETLPLLLGIAGGVMTLRLGNGVTRALLVWLIAGVVLTLTQAGTVANVATLTVPLFLLSGILAERIFTQLAARGMWLVAVATFVWGVIALVNFGRFIKNPANIAAPFIAITLLLVLIFSVGYFLPHLPTALQAFLLGGLALWVYVGWGTAWALTHRTGNDPRELWVTEAVDSDIKLMRETLQEASYQMVNSNSELALLTTVDHPALRWYLRDFENVEFVKGIPVGSSAEGVILPASEIPSLNGNYAKATFDFTQENFVAPEQELLRNLLRYWFFEQSDAVLQPEQLNVWLRIDQ